MFCELTLSVLQCISWAAVDKGLCACVSYSCRKLTTQFWQRLLRSASEKMCRSLEQCEPKLHPVGEEMNERVLSHWETKKTDRPTRRMWRGTPGIPQISLARPQRRFAAKRLCYKVITVVNWLLPLRLVDYGFEFPKRCQLPLSILPDENRADRGTKIYDIISKNIVLIN